MAKAKKKTQMAKEEKVLVKEVKATPTPVTGKKYVFESRDKSVKKEMEAPVEKNLASQVVFDVLNMKGDLPSGLKLQFAESYQAHFIARKGKNALGASKAQNLLVCNGIAKELEAAGIKGIVQPTKKPYFGIKLGGKTPEEIKEITLAAARILGFTSSPKKEEKAKVVTA